MFISLRFRISVSSLNLISLSRFSRFCECNTSTSYASLTFRISRSTCPTQVRRGQSHIITFKFRQCYHRHSQGFEIGVVGVGGTARHFRVKRLHAEKTSSPKFLKDFAQILQQIPSRIGARPNHGCANECYTAQHLQSGLSSFRFWKI